MKQSEILYELLREHLAGKEIIREYVLGNGLRLDFYIPELHIAVEYNGEQHDRMISYFHKDNAGFFSSLSRDAEKKFACEQLGLNLIYFDYRDKLTIELVRERLLGAGNGSGEIKDERYLSAAARAKLRQKALRKERYKLYKQSDGYKEAMKKMKERHAAFKELRRAENAIRRLCSPRTEKKKSGNSTD